MDATVRDFYAQQVMALSDEEKLQLVELIAHELASRNGGQPADGLSNRVEPAVARARFRRHAGAVRLGHATGEDNASIDADIAREGGSSREQD